MHDQEQKITIIHNSNLKTFFLYFTTSMFDLLTIGPKFTRPACRAASTSTARVRPQLQKASRPPRCWCRSTGQTDGHSTAYDAYCILRGSHNNFIMFVWTFQPSMLWHCWLGVRKSIRPVKNLVMKCWFGYLPGARCRLVALYGPVDAIASQDPIISCLI